MPAAKAKAIRLIDVLGAISVDEYITIISNHGRKSTKGTTGRMEEEFKSELTAPVKALTHQYNMITIYI